MGEIEAPARGESRRPTANPCALPLPRQRPTCSTAISSPTHRSACTRRSPPTTYNDMIYAATREEIETRRKTFIRKWRLKHRQPRGSRRPALHLYPPCRRANGAAHGRQTPSNGCTRSLSEGSRRKPCCRRQTPRRCCSGRYSLLDGSTCARSMDGKPSPPSSSISQLTSRLDQITPNCRRPPRKISTTFRTAPLRGNRYW
jgi:hypothetical protein